MTENGRISLSNNSLKERIGAIIHETAVHSEEDFLQQLEKHFKIGTAQLKYL